MKSVAESLEALEKFCGARPGHYSWQYIRTYGGRHIVEIFDDEKCLADKVYADTFQEALHKLCEALGI